MNDTDQESAFTMLTSYGLIPSAANHDDRLTPPASFASWRQSPWVHGYRDRRRLYHSGFIYEVPAQSPDSDAEYFYKPTIFIVLYTTEFVGLTPLPPPSPYFKLTLPSTDDLSEPPWVPLSALRITYQEDMSIEIANCLMPTFPRLVESEMYVLLRDTLFHSARWGQQLAQVTALIYSHSCPGGPDHLPAIVAPRFREFAKWIQSEIKGEANYNALEHLQEDFMQYEKRKEFDS